MIIPRALTGGSAEYNSTGYDSDHIAGNAVEYALFWPLSVAEANAVHTLNGDHLENKFGLFIASSYWWLRSPGDETNRVAVVDTNFVNQGGLPAHRSGPLVRPAFYLDLTAVLLVSGTDGESAKSFSNVGDGLMPAQQVSDALKLTVLDNTFAPDFTATFDKTSLQQGDTVAVTYTGAKIGENNYISCLIEQNGSGKYYGKLADCKTETSGTASLVVPLGFAAGSYTIKIFNEEVNDYDSPDVAGTPTEMALTVPGTPPNNTPSYPSIPSAIDPKTAEPGCNDDRTHNDFVITITGSGNTVDGIKNGGDVLTAGVDYTTDGDKIIIKGEYLDTLPPGEHILTLDMRSGADQKLTITISERPWVNPFVDVNEGNWFYDDLRCVHQSGLFNGTSATTFSPNMPMTRDMVMTVFGRLAGIDIADYSGANFDDVGTAQYYAPYIKWAESLGIVSGVGNSNFAPDANISRQDLAVILYRYAEIMGITLQQTLQNVVFTDLDTIADYAAEAVAAIVCTGVINGKDNGSFDPKANATRAEVAAMLHRFCEAIQ